MGKAELIISPKAWIKMTTLVMGYSTEVEWHGIVSRSENSFVVEDILVPPHKCSAASVVSDQEEYEKWLFELPDEQRDKMKFHGHSHVNFSPTPSGARGVITSHNNDESFRSKLVSGTPKVDGEFYIFFIMNKSFRWTGRIYDIYTGEVWDSADGNISFSIQIDDEQTAIDFINDARSKTNGLK